MPKLKFSYPRGNFPRLCLIGNSNVGKSSLTKLLLSHPQWYKGKVGKTAGSTVRLTIINDPSHNYHIIDLPGFGRMTRLMRKSESYVQDQILNYIKMDKNNIFLMLLIVSADRLEEELEKWYYQNEETIPLTIEFPQLIAQHNIKSLLVLNKIDKINSYKSKIVRKKLTEVLDNFDIKEQGIDSNEGLLGVHETSTKKEIGINELKNIIQIHSQRLNLKNYDKRETLLDQPSIDLIIKPVHENSSHEKKNELKKTHINKNIKKYQKKTQKNIQSKKKNRKRK